MERSLIHTIPAVVVVLLLNTAVPCRMFGAETRAIKCVVEWEQLQASDAKMPPMTMAQLRAEFEKVAAAGAGLKSWEARCRVTAQVGRSQRPGMVASVKPTDRASTTHSTLLVSSGKQWVVERRLGDLQDAKIDYRQLCDGEHVQSLYPRQKVVAIQTLSEFTAAEGAPKSIAELPIGFPPYLLIRREHYYPIPESFPDVRKILADPKATILPWRTRVDGHDCYVVQRTTMTESPIFHSHEDAETWQKQHPDRRPLYMVNPKAAPGDKRVDEDTDRLAIDPQSGFMPARWARGQKLGIPGFTVKSTGLDVPGIEMAQFPVEEITCTHFRKFGSQGWVAGRFEYARYSSDKLGNQKNVARQEVVLEDFRVDRQYPSAFFHFDPPNGYHVLDSSRGIQYAVGDSEKKIAALLAATTAKKAFFENLKKKPAPPLEGALWLNSKPIQPEDVRGKPIQLHFWSIGCGPCLYELPRLEEMWGRSSRQRLADRPVFISIHPYVDGDELQELRDLLREKHITFPVMVDSRDPDAKAWGKTSAYYRVYSNPSDVWIDERGYVVRLDAEARGVGEGDWWMGSVDNKRPTSQIEKGR